MLVAMNPAALAVNVAELKPGGLVIADEGEFTKRNLDKAKYESNPLEDGSLAKWQPQVGIETTTVNDRPGLVAVHRAAPGQVIGVVALDTGAGRIRGLWITMNPDKLRPWNGLITAGRG